MVERTNAMTFADFCEEDKFNRGVFFKQHQIPPTHGNLLALGEHIRKAAIEKEKSITVAVFTANGHRIFEVALPGRRPMNSEFLLRKLRTCQQFQMSTLALRYSLQDKGKTLAEYYGLSETEYAVVGGGIPIFVGDLMVAVVALSGLPGEEDHTFPVECLHEFFGF